MHVTNTESRSSFSPLHEKTQLIDRLEITAGVCNKFANKIIKDLTNNSKDYRMWYKISLFDIILISKVLIFQQILFELYYATV